MSLTDFCSWEQIAQIVVGEFFASLSLFGENQESFAISEGLSLCDAFSEVLFQFFSPVQVSREEGPSPRELARSWFQLA